MFPTSTIRSSKPFELLHIDLWGPYKQPTHLGAKYILRIVDDYGRGLWTFLLKDKSSVHYTRRDFVVFVHNQFLYKVNSIRSDNGTKFLKANCQNLFAELGILHQNSCTYTPQQNGVVERKHRHILILECS